VLELVFRLYSSTIQAIGIGGPTWPRQDLSGRVLSHHIARRLIEDWFKGLSGKFLGSRAGKLLLLAGTDRLDKPLMIGQMQGILYYLRALGLTWLRKVSVDGVSGCGSLFT
jgi:hypothetical protein